MKQRDLIKKLEAGGFVFDHHGSNHDIYIPERLAQEILKRRGIK